MATAVRFRIRYGPILQVSADVLSCLGQQKFKASWRISREIVGPPRELEIEFDDGDDAALAKSACG